MINNKKRARVLTSLIANKNVVKSKRSARVLTSLIANKNVVKSKRSVSEMVGYVLLIVIAISLSIMVYAYISRLIIKIPPKCPEDTSLIIGDYSCDGSILNLTVKNNGLHSIDGFIVHISNDTRKARLTIEETGKNTGGEVYFVPRLNSSDERNTVFDYTKYNQLTKIEIQPFRFEKNRIICETAIISQDISGCGEAVIVPAGDACSVEKNCTWVDSGSCGACTNGNRNNTLICDLGCEDWQTSVCNITDASCVSGPLGTQPISWWRFENNGDDCTAPPFNCAGNGLSFSDTPIFASGKVGQALKVVNSGQYAWMSSAPDNLKITGDLSLEALIDLTAMPSITYAYILGELTGTTPNYGLRVNDKEGQIIFYYAGNSVTSAKNSILAGNWYHIVGVKSGNTLSLYINNISAGTGSSTATPNYGADIFYVGRVGNGLTDEVAIYDKALTTSEISAHFVNSSAGNSYY